MNNISTIKYSFVKGGSLNFFNVIFLFFIFEKYNFAHLYNVSIESLCILIYFCREKLLYNSKFYIIIFFFFY